MILIMAKSNDKNKDNNADNPYRNKINSWVIWTAIALIIFVILLLVFNRRSTVINEEAESDSPIAMVILSPQNSGPVS